MARRLLRGRWLIKAALLVGALLVLGCAAYFWYFDRLVTRQFEGRRWTLPAQVYASPLELYAGLPLSQAELEHELQRLQYRRVEQTSRPGTYQVAGGQLIIMLRPALFVDETRPATRLAVHCGPKALDSVRDAHGTEVPIARLEGLLIGSIFPIHGEDRIVLKPEEVPALLPAALKAIEDRKFDTHHGVDPTAILRALWVDLRARQIEQGGSTLTQQLVKSYFLDSRQTLGRKLREAVMAVSLEAHFTKPDLMNAYINEIFLGQDGDRAIHGFGLASQYYFGKPLAELDLAETALLVAIVRGPSYYDPRRHPERARERRDLVLKLLAEQGVVTADAARVAARRPLGVAGRRAGAYYPAYLDFVRRTLRRDYRESDLTQAGLRIFTALDPRAQEEAEHALEHELAQLDTRQRRGSAPLEGAIVVTAPASGDVLAIVGGRNVGFDGFDRALDARRPVGSLIKPFIYLTALESGRYNAASVVQDVPLSINLPGGKTWRPDNYTHQSNGPVPLVRALAESLNLATIGVGLDVGLDKVAATVQRFGLEHAPEQVPSMLLGTVEATPLEVAELYGGLANGGFRTPLRAVRAVIGEQGQALKAFALEVSQVASPEVIYQLDRMLEQVMERGTGRGARARLPGDLIVGGKSGTSSDYRDSWFAGFSGTHLAVVWVGHDDDQPTGLTGSSGALPVWARVMAALGTTSWDAPMPESLAEAWIDWSSGQMLDPACAAAMHGGAEWVPVAIPAGTQLPVKPGCSSNTVEGVLRRAGEWLRDLVTH